MTCPRIVLSGMLLLGYLTGGFQIATARSTEAPENPRLRVSLNDDWRYYGDGIDNAMYPAFSDEAWERVNIPHTWNATDPFDDEESYRRGVSWYRRHLHLSQDLEGRRLFIYFEGVNQKANVYFNGAFAGSHAGGYTAFAVDVTRFARFGVSEDNLLAVQVDNSHDPDIPPLSVGYALYGGIYRDVWLIATNQVHFSVVDHAAPGVRIETPEVSERRSTVRVRGSVANSGASPRILDILSTVRDADGRVVGTTSARTTVEGGRVESFVSRPLEVERPNLWSPDHPYLYEVTSEIVEDGEVLDVERNPLGVRWFRFEPDAGFLLNGKPFRIRGTNRHQDYQGLGSALSNDLHVRDMEWIKEMGANFVRLAHYPQDPAVLEAADRLGILVWEEIPLVNYVTVSETFVENAKEMLREMIRQHFNHPSIIIWGSMNEIFLWSEEGYRLGQHTDREYAGEVTEIARSLDSLIRSEDSRRYTAMAIHANDWYGEVGVDRVAQVLGFNLYQGWYGGVFEELGPYLDELHRRHREALIFVSEYGAGSDIRINTLNPERFDFSGNWARLYHESYLRQFADRPWLAGTAVWNQFDFSQPHTGGTIPHVNQKGLQTWDRRPKDVYYLYKTNWNPEPMVHIASRDWVRRFDRYDSGSGDTTDDERPDFGPSAREKGSVGLESDECNQPIDVYSNLSRVELLVNGISYGAEQPDDIQKASWIVCLNEGRNAVVARGSSGNRTIEDRLELTLTRKPMRLIDEHPFESVAVNVGATAQYVGSGDVLWEPDRPYGSGSFGFVGGVASQFNKDYVIEGSGDTPLYFTYRSGLKGYRFDVPDGDYEVEFHLAEPSDISPGERVFDIAINGQTVVAALDLAERPGFRRAAPLTISASTSNGDGLTISFVAHKGEPILNAVRVRTR